jgi:hypothetical protein
MLIKILISISLFLVVVLCSIKTPLDSETRITPRSLSSSATSDSASGYKITASATSGGSISPSGELRVGAGGRQSFTIIPDSGYHIDSFFLDGVNADLSRLVVAGVSSVYEFENINADHSIHVTFATDANAYTITLTTEGSGRIVGVSSERPSNNIEQPEPVEPETTLTQTVAASYGESKYFAVLPARGYAIDSILVDGARFEPHRNPLLGMNQYRWPICDFQNIRAAHAVHAWFHKEQ